MSQIVIPETILLITIAIIFLFIYKLFLIQEEKPQKVVAILRVNKDTQVRLFCN